MYNKAHGIMFHHFHDDKKHIVGQGSIDAKTLNEMLDYYGSIYNIIDAKQFYEKSQNNTLSKKDVCITFDDGLLCQYDIAYPVLKERGLTAFWFIYTSPIDGIYEKLEIYRHFRFSKYPDIDSFYEAFFSSAHILFSDLIEKESKYDFNQYLSDFSFYTYNDRKFRYFRDMVLGSEKYNTIMDKMIEDSDYNVVDNSKLLWINKEQIKNLQNNQHIIGLHSYSHPTMMVNKSETQQNEEYLLNKKELEQIINEHVYSVSYPCNSYNETTIKYMETLNINIGFRANMKDVVLGNQKLEYPREDHANILKMMKEN